MKISSSIFSVAAGLLAVACNKSSTLVSAIEVGDSLPDGLTLHHGFPPERIALADRTKGKNVLLVGLPGAFTPT